MLVADAEAQKLAAFLWQKPEEVVADVENQIWIKRHWILKPGQSTDDQSDDNYKKKSAG